MANSSARTVAAIVPCSDIEASTAFYEQLGLSIESDHGSYRILGDGNGWQLHLTSEVPDGWLVSGRNPFGLYFYTAQVELLARRLASIISGPNKHAVRQPWGMCEFAISDPDGTLVKIGWTTRNLPEIADPK